MMKKTILTTTIMLLGAFLLACTPQTETTEAPAAVVETGSEIVEEVEAMEEMAEESHSEDGEAMMEEKEEEGEMAMAEGGESVYTVNSADSSVSWKGAKAVGNSHVGTIDIAEGALTVADGQLIGGSFVIDMTTITATDGANSRLIGHLESDDFFGVATHPTASLVINSAESLDGDQYAVAGDLTIKGITNPIEFTATALEADGQFSATADIVFDRALYDVQYGSGTFFEGLGDDLINDEIEISVELVAAK